MIALLEAHLHGQAGTSEPPKQEQWREADDERLDGFDIAIFSAGLWFLWTDGGRYPEAINVFRVLASGLSIGIFCSPAINLLFRLRDYQFLFRLVAVLLVISVPLISGLVTTELGVLGAAMGATISVACLNVSIAWRAWKLLTGEEAVIHVIPAQDNAARAAA